MFGAIIGDIAGSRFEGQNIKTKSFTLFHPYCRFTDDTVMSIAVYKALHESKKTGYVDLETKLVSWMQLLGNLYPYAGYGGRFRMWLNSDNPKPYNSYGNGSAMRTGECGWIAESMEEAMELAERCAAVTHNHPEGIKGAQAVTACIYLARNGKDKSEIRQYVNEHFYQLDFEIDKIREGYHFDVSCQGSVPQAIEAFLESYCFEEAIKTAISIGGDTDTIGAITGSIAEAYYGIDERYIQEAVRYLDKKLIGYLS